MGGQAEGGPGEAGPAEGGPGEGGLGQKKAQETLRKNRHKHEGEPEETGGQKGYPPRRLRKILFPPEMSQETVKQLRPKKRKKEERKNKRLENT